MTVDSCPSAVYPNRVVRPFQSVGAFGPRDFDKYVWQAPIPLFDPANDAHQRLADLGVRAAGVTGEVEIPANDGFQAARRRIRATLEQSGLNEALNASLGELLPS